MSDRVHMGAVITTDQACRGILKLIQSPILGDIDLDANVGRTLARIVTEDPETGVTPFACLSTGEQRLVTIAQQVWCHDEKGVGILGGLDKDNRRKVLIALFYLHLGRHLDIEYDREQFIATFGAPVAEVR